MPALPATLDQLALPFTPDVRLRLAQAGRRTVSDERIDELHRRIGHLLGEPLDLVATNNRRTLVSWRRLDDGMLRVRCLRAFALATDEVVGALVQVIAGQRQEARLIVQEYAAQGATAQARGPRYAPPMGRHHDLREVYRRQNEAHFEGAFRGQIGWSLGPRGRIRRSIRLGSWQPEHRLIKVHPVLDAANVPAYVLRFVVYHEMLHGALGANEEGGRNVFHTREFRRQEAEHPDHDRAQRWIRCHRATLLEY